MKKFLKLMTTIALSSSIAMTGLNPLFASAQEGEVIELEWWYAFTGSSQENNDALTQQFNETVGAEEGIHVTATTQGNYNDIYTKIQAGFVAGEVPHVSVVNSLSIVQFGKNNMLEPLEPYADQEAMDDFYPGLLLNSYYDGVQYGYPYLRSTPIMYYNSSLFGELGIDENLDTLDNVLTAAQTLVDNGHDGLGLVADQWHFDGLLRQNGGGWLNEDQTEAITASPENQEIFQKLRDAQAAGIVKFYNSGDEIAQAYTNQQVGMWFQSTGSLTNTLQIAEDQGFEINTAFIPTNSDVRNVPTGGNNIAMIAGHSEEEKEAAAIFMNWLVQPEQVVHSHIVTGYLPTRQSVADNEQIVALYEETPQFRTALEQLDYAGIEPNAPGYAEIVQVEQEMIQEIFITDTDLEEILTRTQENINQILEANR
ncbi:ABC transporter substrate-binding protein [Fundicoccus culcitae]|uniref:ABC transporter substrate-binding protein n=1 Tax=Fundicoccus culcitae TaxID=2969821 RepID=A0ABY5P3M4_9LACT|nr:ABC transporter substrate-binding protein [Fundicoccus culcitae]UUX33181.1 ABC transporter substrate-binding protein [Fundicoccus culcitae]